MGDAKGLLGRLFGGRAGSGPSEGQDAPAFTAKATTGATVSLAEFKGRGVVLAFFPKAFTFG